VRFRSPRRSSVHARPPMRSRASKISTSTPAVWSSRAAMSPENPAPTMRTLADMTTPSCVGWWGRRRASADVRVAQGVEDVGAGAAQHLAPDEADDAGAEDDRWHDDDERGGALRPDHHVEVREDEHEDRAEAERGERRRPEPDERGVAAVVAPEEGDDGERRDEQEEDEAEGGGVGEPGEHRHHREELAQRVAGAGD